MPTCRKNLKWLVFKILLVRLEKRETAKKIVNNISHHYLLKQISNNLSLKIFLQFMMNSVTGGVIASTLSSLILTMKFFYHRLLVLCTVYCFQVMFCTLNHSQLVGSVFVHCIIEKTLWLVVQSIVTIHFLEICCFVRNGLLQYIFETQKL